MEGLDDIGLTLEKADHIENFETSSRARRPWA
jgi:3-isopropylmalate dehydratase small subunit